MSNTCEWIGEHAHSSCCNPTVEGRAYCEEHLWKIYQKGTALGKRKKDAKRAQMIWDIESEVNAALQELIEEGKVDY